MGSVWAINRILTRGHDGRIGSTFVCPLGKVSRQKVGWKCGKVGQELVEILRKREALGKYALDRIHQRQPV